MKERQNEETQAYKNHRNSYNPSKQPFGALHIYHINNWQNSIFKIQNIKPLVTPSSSFYGVPFSFTSPRKVYNLKSISTQIYKRCKILPLLFLRKKMSNLNYMCIRWMWKHYYFQNFIHKCKFMQVNIIYKDATLFFPWKLCFRNWSMLCANIRKFLV